MPSCIFIVELNFAYYLVLRADPVPEIVPDGVVPVDLDVLIPCLNLKSGGSAAHPENKRRGQRNQNHPPALKPRPASYSCYAFIHWPPPS